MMKKNKEKREFIRVGVKRLTSIIKNHGGGFELIEESSEEESEENENKEEKSDKSSTDSDKSIKSSK